MGYVALLCWENPLRTMYQTSNVYIDGNSSVLGRICRMSLRNLKGADIYGIFSADRHRCR